MTKCLLEQPMAEQPTEEVQLTELRPVEHSRIKVVGSYESTDTDGLRALRSLTSKQLDEFEQFGTRYPRKRKDERWRHLEIGLRLDEALEEQEKAAKRLATSAEMTNPVESDEEEEDDDYGVNGDFEYLEERNEIYDYRQREDCSSPEIEGAAVESAISLPEVEKVQEKPVAEIKKGKPGRPRGRPKKKKRKPVRSSKRNIQVASKTTKSCTTTVEGTDDETELRNKINDIIQKNYLLEQENNNDVESGIEKMVVPDPPPKKKRKYEEKKYQCDLCDAMFKGSGGLRTHFKVVHYNGPGYECDECGKRFPLKERLKLHMRTHTGFKPYQCKSCEKTFARGGQLVQHERTHTKLKPYSCHLCSGTFTCAANLALHVKRHNGQKDHKCELCSRAFVRRDALKKHHECLHQDLKSFECKICKKTFKGHLPQHMRTHAQDRPHGCADCGQRFAQKSQLTVHQRTHSGQRPFRCLVCWQAFAHSTALKLHTRRHTGERPFKCVECNAGFTQLPHWKKHMKCIHGRSDPYCCTWCNRYFRIKNDLEAHQKSCEQQPPDWDSGSSSDGLSSTAMAKFRIMNIERMRLLLAVLIKRISKDERLDELGFGKRLIDEVLIDSLLSAGKKAVRPSEEVPEFESLKKNVEVFLEWTVPPKHWDVFQKNKKSVEDILEVLGNA